MRVGVIGGGLMGSGIAEVCARSGVDVTLIEVDEARLDQTHAKIDKSLDRAASAGRLEQDDRTAPASGGLQHAASRTSRAPTPRSRRSSRTSRPSASCSKLDAALPDAEFLASNTSSVPIMNLAAGTSKPERVLGMHFFNPVPVLPLVELVRSIMTSEQTLERARQFAEETLGKTSIDSQDCAGFVVNALLVPYILSAVRMYESGFAAKEDIDRGMVKGCAHPMGPLALADLIGLDTLLAVSESLYDEFRDPSSVAPALLNRMVEAGLLGRKSGRGFYDYSS